MNLNNHFYGERIPDFRKNQPEYVGVVGGREMTYEPVAAWMRKHLDREKHVIVTGDARGADQAARRFAEENGFLIVVVPAQHLWDRYGKSAGMLRNPIVARLATSFVVAFPDGQSRGTHDTTKYAASLGKVVIHPLGNGQATIFDHGVLE